MKIAVLAWGSLVWDRQELAIAEDFRPNGPDLPVEFCRVSGDGRLTLVIGEAVGTSCQTYSALSAHDDLDAALENLWIREGSKDERLPRHIRNSGRVGFVDVAAGKANTTAIERHPRSVEAINAWAIANDYDAVIWTALASNFHEPEKAAEPFSVDATISYLEALEALKHDAALSYIRSAPPEIQTLVRAAVNARWPEG